MFLLLLQDFCSLVAKQADLVLGRTKSCKFRITGTSAGTLSAVLPQPYMLYLLLFKNDLSEIYRMVDPWGVVQLFHLLMKNSVKRSQMHCKRSCIKWVMEPRMKCELPHSQYSSLLNKPSYSLLRNACFREWKHAPDKEACFGSRGVNQILVPCKSSGGVEILHC